MIRKLLVLVIVAMTLNGCFIVDELLAPPPAQMEVPLQERTQDSVSAFIRERSIANRYKPYGFSQVKIIKPLEIVAGEKYEDELAHHPDSVLLKNKIDSLQSDIAAKKLERTIKIEHFFTLKDTLKHLNIFEVEFSLNEKLQVVDERPEILLTLSPDYEEILGYYFHEYTIFLASTYEESRQLSIDFYNFFKTHLESLESVDEKSKFLEHTLVLCKEVKETGVFNQQRTVENIVIRFIKEERKDIVDYKPLQFSTLYQKEINTPGAEGIEGYYFFHKFSGSYDSIPDTNVVFVEFSPWYEIKDIYQMDPPFDPYFNE